MSRVRILGEDRAALDLAGGTLREAGFRVETERRMERWADPVEDVDLVLATPEARDDALIQPVPEEGFATPILLLVPPGAPDTQPFLADRFVDRLREPYRPEELPSRAEALIEMRDTLLGKRPPRRTGRQGLSRGTRLRMQLAVAAALARWADRRDAFDAGHGERVAGLSAMIAEGLGLDAPELARLQRAATYHDIGKAGLSSATLNRQGPLDPGEQASMRDHPQVGAAVVAVLDEDTSVVEAVRYHHERPDGHGYYHRDADHIPRAAAVVAVAEAFDAMTHSHLQRRHSRREALRRLRELAGDRFDEQCVGALTDVLRTRPGNGLAAPVPPSG